MRNGFLGSIAALAAAAGLASAQPGVVPAFAASPYGQAGGSDIIPVNGGSDLLAPPVQVIPVPAVGPGGTPGYPPPSPFSMNDPNAPEPEPPIRPATQFFFNAEYLGWFARSQKVGYPFITTSGAASQGVLFAPTTTALFGTSNIPYNLIGGFRLTGGFFWDGDRRSGFDVSAFLLQNRRKTFTALSDPAGNPLLAVPFVNELTGLQSAIVVTSPGVSAGGIRFETASQSWGIQADCLLNLYRSCADCYWGSNVTLFYGPRFYELEESINLDTSSNLAGSTPNPPQFAFTPTGVPGFTPAGNRNISTHDFFRVTNNFYAGNIGLRSEWSKGRWTCTLVTQIAGGLMHTTTETQGVTTFTRGTPPITGSIRGGILATPENEGRTHQDRFAVLPEVTLNLGYQWTPRVATFIGYNLIYVSDVVRAGNLVNPVVNPGVVPSSPTFGATPGIFPRTNRFDWSDFWLQGFNVGVAFKF